MSKSRRIQELEELAAKEGITLPFPAKVSAGMEERGQYVDLFTGMVGSDQERIELTTLGEAVAIVDRRWEDD